MANAELTRQDLPKTEAEPSRAQEASETQEQEPGIEQRENIPAETQGEVESLNLEFIHNEERLTDAYALATAGQSTGEDNENPYSNLLENGRSYLQEGTDQTIAADLKKVETAFITDRLKQALDSAFPDWTQEQKTQAITDIKAGLFNIILAGNLTAEQLQSIADDGIRIQARSSQAQTGIRENSFASFRFEVSEEGERTAHITIYADFFKSRRQDAKVHVLAHEFATGLVEGRDLWNFDEIRAMEAACADPNYDISKMPVEIQQALRAVWNPDKNIVFSNAYVKRRLEAIYSYPDHAKERFNVAKEMLAEYGAGYLLGGSDKESFYDARLKFCSEEELAQKIAEVNPDIAISGKSKEDLLAILESSGILKGEKAAYDFLSSKIGRRNERFSVGANRPEQPYEIFDDYDMDWIGTSGYGMDELYRQGGVAGNAQSPLGKMIEILTGIKPSQGGIGAMLKRIFDTEPVESSKSLDKAT